MNTMKISKMKTKTSMMTVMKKNEKNISVLCVTTKNVICGGFTNE